MKGVLETNSPKVCVLIANSDGALYKFRKTLIEKLSKKGHRVITVSGYSLKSNITGEDVDSCYADRLTDLGVEKHVKMDFDGKNISAVNFLLLILKLRVLLRDLEPDIVHCFTHKACLAGSLAILLSSIKPKIIFTITGLGRAFSDESLRGKLIRTLIMSQYSFVGRFCHKFFFQNSDDEALFKKRCKLSSQQCILVGGSGVDLLEFKSNPSKCPSANSNYLLKKPEDEIITVLSLSRGMIQKGFFEFYEAARFLAQLYPNKFRFLHAGNLDSQITKKISNGDVAEFSRAHSVEYLGFQEDIREILDMSDILVHPSYYREGVPRSLIEALAMDKVIITCDTVGNRETVLDGWNGFFCEPKNCKSLISAILKSDANFISQCKGRSLALAKVKFDVEIIDNLVIESYFN